MASYFNSFTKTQHLNLCANESMHSILRKSILKKKAFLSKLMIILVSAVFSFGSRLLILQSLVLQWAFFFIILEMTKISYLRWRIKKWNKRVIWWYKHLNCLFFPSSPPPPPPLYNSIFFYFYPLFSPILHIFICSLITTPQNFILYHLHDPFKSATTASLLMNWWYCSPRDRNESCLSETLREPVEKRCGQNLLENWSLRYFSYT